MTWEKCDFCDRKENGVWRMRNHMETTHAQEFKRWDAQEKLDICQNIAAREAQYITDHEDYQAALLLDLPRAARKLIEDSLACWPYSTNRAGEAGIDRLRWAVEHWHPQQIALAQKALAELNKEGVA